MFLKDISIKNFRNYENEKIMFSPLVNIIYGDNAQGKTNLLESIFVLGLTKSHRAVIDNSLIKEDSLFANICGNINIASYDTKLEVNIGKKIKKLKINNNEVKKISDYLSRLNIIIFCPDDLELIKGSPGVRRKYFNIQLSQIKKTYFILLNFYINILKIRNELLKQYLKNKIIDNNYFDIINQYFIDKSAEIYVIRKKYIDHLNAIAPDIFYDISGIKDFNMRYKPNIDIDLYENENIKKIIKGKLDKLRDVEFKLGTTLVGPSRDDIEFYIKDQNLKFFGSQGQQRMAVLALKLAEIEVFKEYSKETPILLLDDVFSELDDNKKNNLLKYLKNDIQTIITTTDLKNLDKKIVDKANLIRVQLGKIIIGKVK